MTHWANYQQQLSKLSYPQQASTFSYPHHHSLPLSPVFHDALYPILLLLQLLQHP
jgi:hypothetical protein